MTVSVLDDATRAVEAILESDLRYRWYSGSGAGGQHRNKHQNCLELIHLPTGISRSAQTRSRETSRRDAMEALEQAVSAMTAGNAHAERNQERAAQIGLGMRADKRRTYRFRDDQVRDDLTGLQTSCTRFMRGHVDLLWPIGDQV